MADPGNIWGNFIGTLSSFFRFGKNNAGIKGDGAAELSARNASDSGLANINVLAPTSSTHAVNKLYVDTLEKPLIVGAQADTSVSIPNNTGVERFLVVTTPGSGAAIGDLLLDDGSGSGQMTILPAVNGRTLAIQVALTGGSVEFDADSLYQWDGDGSSGSVQWVKIGDIGSISNAVKATRFSIDNTPSQQSTNQIPAGSVVHKCTVVITTPFSAGATIDVGDGTTDDVFQGDAQVDPQTAGRYVVFQDTEVGSAVNVVKTVGNTPAAGAGFIVVEHSKPNG